MTVEEDLKLMEILRDFGCSLKTTGLIVSMSKQFGCVGAAILEYMSLNKEK